MTGLAQPAQLLAVAWQLPATLVALWLSLVVLRRQVSPWYFVIATGACSAVPLVALRGATVLGRTSGRERGGGIDIPLWSFLNIFTGLGSVFVLLLLTGIVELVRLWRAPATEPNAGSAAVVARLHHGPEGAIRFHGRRVPKSDMTFHNPQETHFTVRQHRLLKPLTADQNGEDTHTDWS